MADMIQIRKNLFLERKISYGNWTGILWQISGVILEWQKKIGHLLSVAPPSTECTKYPFWNVDNLICKQVYNHSMSFLKILVVLLPDWLIFTQFNTKYAEFGDNMNKKSIYCCCNFFWQFNSPETWTGFWKCWFSKSAEESKKSLSLWGSACRMVESKLNI